MIYIIEIDYSLNDKEIKNKILSSDKKYKKEINISPIVNYIEKINNFFNNYILNIQLFIKDLEHPLKSLKSYITAINSEINSIKEDYYSQQNNYISKYIEYLSLNDNLKIIYNSVEENLVNYYKDKNILINKYKDLQEMRIKLDLTIKEKIEKEEEILQKFNLLGNFGFFYSDSANKEINSIKILFLSLLEHFELCLDKIYTSFIKSFMGPMEQFLDSKKEIKDDNKSTTKNDLENILDSYIQKIDEKDRQI